MQGLIRVPEHLMSDSLLSPPYASKFSPVVVLRIGRAAEVSSQMLV